MKTRPWIWFIIANAIFISGIVTLVTIAIRNKEKEVPVAHAR
jgi:hypothetical protein